MVIDRLIEKTKQTKCPVCVGLDTVYDYIPKGFLQRNAGESALAYAARSIASFNFEIIQAVADLVPSVKIQVACYEMYGLEGMRAFSNTLKFARDMGLVTIADVKRNDIGSTASTYASAYLSGTNIDGEEAVGFDADFITLNPYLGTDGIKPFTEACKKTGKGLFCLIKTSNPSSGEFQDLKTDGVPVYMKVAQKVAEWGEGLIGQSGYSSVGAVVGATYPGQAKELRKMLPETYFLIPGYGAQGATADDIAVNFDENGLGGVVNSSRGILLAYKNEKYKGLDFAAAARQAVLDMKEEILAAFEKRGIHYK